MLNESFFFNTIELAIRRTHILKSKKDIDELFIHKKRIHGQHVSIVYQYVTNRVYSFKVGFSVPKRSIRFAHQRNLLKRRLRESFRPLIPNIEKIAKEKGLSVHLMLVYSGKTVQTSAKIKEDIYNAVMKLVHCNK